MRATICAVLTAFVLAMLAPSAMAQGFDDPMPFDRTLTVDIAGGSYVIGEDDRMSERLRDSETGVEAQFQVVRPYRTEEFGSGVAFYVLDASNKRYLRIAFNDREEEAKVVMSIRRSAESKDEDSDLVFEKPLSFHRNAVGRIGIRLEDGNRIVVSADGQVIPVDVDFVPQNLHVQVYCAFGWARFVDGVRAS